jgi:hypothetical protein
MIKKFYEYIKENKTLTYEELSDQFLRLKEVFDMEIDTDHVRGNLKRLGKTSSFFLFPLYPINWRDELRLFAHKYEPQYSQEVYEELGNIKRRIEIEYPIKFSWEQKSPNYFIMIKLECVV